MLVVLLQLLCYILVMLVFTKFVKFYLSRKAQTLSGQLLLKLRNPILLALFLGAVYTLLCEILPSELLAPISIIIKLAGIGIGAYICLSISGAFRTHYEATKPSMKNFMSAFSAVVKLLVGVCVIVLVLNLFNINLTAILAGLGIGAVVIGLALQETINNFFAGLYLATDRPIREGDYIRLENGQEGYVEKIGWRSTRIRELPGNIVVVPNSKIVNSIVVNYYLPNPETACIVRVGVAYESDLEKVERVTTEVAEQVMKKVVGEIDFRPFIRYQAFGDYSIYLDVVMRVKEPTQKFSLVHEFIKELHKKYKEEGIEIPFPIRTIYTRHEG
jgi:small-conductance mechanosensitive channel